MISSVEKVLSGNNFKLVKETSQGEFGLVYLCVKIKENKVVKQIRQEQITKQQRDGLYRYVSSIQKHACVVATEQVFTQPQVAGDIYIVMEYCDGGNLYDHRQELKPRELCEFMRNVLDAIDYFHTKNITNIGLKATSILLKQEGNRKVAKLCDFGVLRHIQMLNPYSTAQESAADSWNFCAVFYELVTGENPFPKEGSDKIAISKTLPIMRWLFEKMYSQAARKVSTKELFKNIFQRIKPEWENEIDTAQQTARKRKYDVVIKTEPTKKEEVAHYPQIVHRPVNGTPAIQPSPIPTKAQEETYPSPEHTIRILTKDCQDYKDLVLKLKEELEVLRPYKIKAEEEKRQPGRQWQAVGTAQDSASLRRLEQQNRNLNLKLKAYEDWAKTNYTQLDQDCKKWATECQRLEAKLRAQEERTRKEKEQARIYFDKQISESQSLALQANRNYWSLLQQWTDERQRFRELQEREIKKESQPEGFNALKWPEQSLHLSASEMNVCSRP